MSDLALFIHSTGLGPFMWKPYLATLPDGVASLSPVNLGYQLTMPWPAGQAFSIQEEVTHLLSHVPPTTTGLHLFGHSYGGFAALALAQQSPVPVRSLWLYEPVLFGALRHESAPLPAAVQADVDALFGDTHAMLDEQAAGSEAWVARFIDYWNQPGAWQAMSDKARAITLALSHKMFREVACVAQEPQAFERYALDVPLTLVQGEHTTAPARQMVARLAEVNPHAQVHALAGLGHMGVITAPEQVASTMAKHWRDAEPHARVA